MSKKLSGDAAALAKNLGELEAFIPQIKEDIDSLDVTDEKKAEYQKELKDLCGLAELDLKALNDGDAPEDLDMELYLDYTELIQEVAPAVIKVLTRIGNTEIVAPLQQSDADKAEAARMAVLHGAKHMRKGRRRSSTSQDLGRDLGAIRKKMTNL